MSAERPSFRRRLRFRARPTVRRSSMTSRVLQVPGAVLTAVVALALPGCVVGVDTRGYLQHDRRQFDAQGNPHVRLATFDGSIEVRGWDRATVEVNIEKRAADRALVESIEIESDQQGQTIRVEAKPPKSGTWETNVLRGPGMSVKLVAYVPVKSQVTVETADGDLDLEHLDGQAVLRTLDGAVRAVDIAGSLRVSTGDGAVRVEGVTGAVEVHTLDGSIAVAGRPDALKLLSSDGAVVVRIGEGVAMSSDWDIETYDGSIELHVPEAFDAVVDAKTDDGRVSSDVSSQVEDDRSRRELKATIGAGGRTIRLRSGDGRISLRAS